MSDVPSATSSLPLRTSSNERPCLINESTGPNGRYVIIHFRARLADPEATFSCRDGVTAKLASADEIRSLRIAAATLEVLAGEFGWKH